MRKIIVDILDDGEIRIETKGFHGPVCLEETKFLKELLGSEKQTLLTATFYQRENETITKIVPLCG